MAMPTKPIEPIHDNSVGVSAQWTADVHGVQRPADPGPEQQFAVLAGERQAVEALRACGHADPRYYRPDSM
jgi:hypothetical protein